jgi:hypothetical protein
MEPIDDRELNQLLQEWKAPQVPHTLRPPRSPRPTPWRWLLTGSIRIPVPIGIAIVAAVAVWMYWTSIAARRESPAVPESVTLADFQPVERLEVRVVGAAK